MQAATGVPVSTDLVDALDQFLHSISHDLRSPLLTMSLGTELIADAVPANDDRAALALDSLRNGAKDLERMLDAITLLSRARKRALVDAPVALFELLGGHLVISDVDRVERLQVRVDSRIVTETIAAVAGGAAIDCALAVDESSVHLTLPLPEDAPECEGSPLAVLMGALRTYAGTPIARVAALHAQLERQGGSMFASEGRLRMSLPLAEANA